MRQVIGIFVGIFASALAARGDAVRADLGLRNVYWQVLPSDVRAVKVDGKGKAWFELDGTDTVEQLKAEVERGVGMNAPWLKSGKILLFDSKGRIWLTAGLELLLGYGPSSRTVDRATGHPQQSRRASGRGSTWDLRSGD